VLRSAWLSVSLSVLAAALACSPSRTAFQLGVPGSRVDVWVAQVTQRDAYLEADLQLDGRVLRTYLPATGVCSHVLAGETGVQFASSAAYGTVIRGDERCEAVGIGSLAEWRTRRPRSTSTARSVIPSAQASYRRVYEDEEVVLLRGRFPLTGHLGFAGLGDSIAVVPRIPICAQPLSRETSTLEFFPAGRNVLTLASSAGRCPIQGLIQPEGGDAAAP
jgi:hypothetical protein